MRKTPLIPGEFYHIYNRGTEKRNIFLNRNDVDRFSKSMTEFNGLEPIGSIYENSFNNTPLGSPTSKLKLVHIICYCLNPNHYHFILEQIANKGIEKFMHRLATGYTKYFNEKYKRSGALFQGRFKSSHIDSNDYLLHASAYVNLNYRAHGLGSPTSKLIRSSWEEYTENRVGICKTEPILGQFNTIGEYKTFAHDALELTLERKTHEKELADLLFE